MEEPFHEDAVLYRDLKDWLRAEGLTTLIADGEGEASPVSPALGAARGWWTSSSTTSSATA